jgi:tRNA A-37 threonylcarbamoyl transferase component Bud32
LIIDGNRQATAEEISLATDRLLSHKYLVQSVFIHLLQWLMLFAGLALMWFIRPMIPVRQAQVFLVYSIVLFALQYFFLSSHLWFEAFPLVIIVACSWLILLAYREENQLFVHSNLRYNNLLVDALFDLSQHQSSDKIQLLLAQASPDKILIKKVAEVAAYAKKENNSQLTRVLFAWHKSISDRKESSFEKVAHKEANKTLVLSKELFAANESLSSKKTAQTINKSSEEAMPALDNAHQIVDDFDDENFEQTMVITPGQKPPKLSSTLTLKAEKFGRYKVEGMLGKGAMGIVYQGVDPKINRHVAIKTLQITDSIDIDDVDEAKQRFFKEAETAGRLSHANIVTIYDVGEEEMLGYIAMDLLTGAPLSHFIKPMNLLPTPLVYQLMIQITDALDYAHRQNVVHRDIKPGNIIYDDDQQRATVTDFGIAYVADNSKTRTGVIMGSPYYMSPEQILGKQVDGRSDIFSLGATFYQLLCGHLPFEGDSVMSVVYQISNEKHISVTKCNDKLPPSAARITNKALQKDVDKRYQSMQEFKLALISALKRDFKKAPII